MPTKKVSKSNFVVSAKKPVRLDVFVADAVRESRSMVKKLFEEDRLRINGVAPKKAGAMVKDGDKVKIVAKKRVAKVEALPILDIHIVGETDDYVVIEKPAGILVHPTEAHEDGTIAHWVLAKYPKTKGVGDHPLRPGIVHRLDKDASGLLVIAKNKKMFEYLKEQFKAREVEKEYSVLVYEVIEPDHGVIDFAIDRGSEGRMVSRPRVDLLDVSKVGSEQKGKKALTEFWVEQRFARFTLLRVRIHTGRTHQIRVHMFAYNHPVVGDTIYCNKKLIKKTEQPLDRLFLHARRLGFTDLNGKRQEFDLPIPKQLSDYLKGLAVDSLIV